MINTNSNKNTRNTNKISILGIITETLINVTSRQNEPDARSAKYTYSSIIDGYSSSDSDNDSD